MPERRLGHPEHFQGPGRDQVWVTDLIEAADGVSPRASVVEFPADTTTVVHSHSDVQFLYVLSGQCRVWTASAGKPRVLNPGDAIAIPPNECHLHGASENERTSHLAFTVGKSDWERC